MSDEPTTQTDDETRDTQLSENSFFQRAQWSLRHLLLGLLILVIIKAINFLPRDLLEQIPMWVNPFFFMAVFLALLIYPFWGMQERFQFPRIGKMAHEARKAISLTFYVLVAIYITDIVWSLIAPEISLTPLVWQNAARSNQYAIFAFIMLLVTTIGPIAEEIFFRGYLYNAIKARSSSMIAMIVSSLLFAIAHSYGTAPTVVVFLLGICLTVIYERRNTLITPIFVHAGINVVGAFFFALLMILNAYAPVMGVGGETHPDGILVTVVLPETGAARAGIREGDIISKVDDTPVRSLQDLIQFVQFHKIGDVVRVEVIRDSATIEMEVTLGPRQQ